VVVYRRIRVRHALSKSSLPDLDYALNPYIGCFHACSYCYARGYVGGYVDAGRSWGEIVYIKENLVDVLRVEVKRFRAGIVGVSTITDPYQPIEAELGIVREAIKVLLNSGFSVSIQTKSDLVLRDIDILKRFIGRVDVGFTITSLNDDLIRYVEPRAPLPSLRVKALRKLSSESIETWIFYGPVIPGFNDDEETIRGILRLGRETNSKVLIDKIHLRDWIMETLRHALENIFGRNYSKVLNKEYIESWWLNFKERILKMCKEYNITCYPQLAEPKPTQTKNLTNFT